MCSVLIGGETDDHSTLLQHPPSQSLPVGQLAAHSPCCRAIRFARVHTNPTLSVSTVNEWVESSVLTRVPDSRHPSNLCTLHYASCDTMWCRWHLNRKNQLVSYIKSTLIHQIQSCMRIFVFVIRASMWTPLTVGDTGRHGWIYTWIPLLAFLCSYRPITPDTC